MNLIAPRAAYLAFVSSRIAFNDFVRPEAWKFTDANEGPGYCMPDENVVVRAFTCPAAPEPKGLFGPAERPTWLNNIELVELGANVAAPDFEFYAERRDEDDEVDPPEAWQLVNGVDYHGCERPTFGRRLLLVWYCGDDEDARAIDRAQTALKSSLGPAARAVWHGVNFQAVAFLDPRRCEVIAESLRRHLAGEYVWDWLLVDIAGLPVPDQSGLSPLAVWMQNAGRAGRKA
ncbi:hypothetical protein L2449_16720 [Mesorhizobium muleiense]|uniref:hypothetical protein n=1 Tax=Mesorhizobium muleiense TaxID=1004279 RepID=UPI001F27529B|nr:hypothetical protein [Mesorhizobium muleiense]MCF6118522.1 hypothetical protein [Mesorhizobium muleiense]